VGSNWRILADLRRRLFFRLSLAQPIGAGFKLLTCAGKPGNVWQLSQTMDDALPI
jgi:hypothetical protein